MADRVILQTSEGLAWLNRVMPTARGAVIPNFISFPLVAIEPRLIPNSVINPDRKLMLAVGRLTEEKGFDLLLTVFSRLASMHEDWDLVILSEGPLRPAIEAQIHGHGLRERVRVPGRAGNIGDWYRRADLYVMSSRFEGFPNTLAEAMAYGCAAVSFDCDTGPRDIIRHEVDGLLVPNGDVEALPTTLDRLMRDENFRRVLGARAIEVRERVSIEKIAGIWEALFKDLKNGK